MPLVVGVSFKKAGKVYYFDPNGIELHEGDHVIAETARGSEFGEIMLDPKEVTDDEIVSPLRKVIREASESDIRREETNRQKEKQAYTCCQQKIQQHDLPMKLIDAEYCFDGSQVTFFFSAEARVDFRELVKDLAGALRTKVQLHQVGVRDEAKLFGGLGPCGRMLCCTTFMSDFEPVSMKMAKEQSLFLNPLKFSGTCGKLMCCLKYEYHTYKEAKQRLPNMGSIIETPKGSGKVIDMNVISESIGVVFEDGSNARYSIEELGYVKPGCPAAQGTPCGGCGSSEALEKMAEMLEENPEVATEAVVAVAETVADGGEPAGDAQPAEEGAPATGEDGQPKKRNRRRPHRNRRKKT